MGMFSNFFQKECSLGAQPHSGWSWSLSVNGVPTAHFDWEDIARALDGLGPHDDSFVILEQRKGKDYWFIQSAMNRAGPKPGWYTVEVGWGGGQGKGLLDLDVRTVEEAIPFFRTAYGRKPLELSQFEDQSDMLG